MDRVRSPPAELSIGECGPSVVRVTGDGERANAILITRAMDDQPAWWPTDVFGDFRLHTIREIVLHVMVETAAHAGHLDIVRELIDRKQWRVLTVEPD